MPLRTRPVVAKRPKTGRGSPRPAERRSEPPLHPNKVPATAGKTEPPPSTNAAIVTELTMDDDWVRRTPSALLILPPPPQFADPEPPPSHQRPLPPKPPMPARLPSCSHTAAPAMRPSRSHTAAPATARLARQHALETEAATTQASRVEVACTPYATVAATPTHHPLPQNDITQAPPPAQQPTLPTIVVKRLPNWVGHFRTIAEALGHAPNARAHKKGAMFLPKTQEELRTVKRCLEEAAARDSAISFEVRGLNPSEQEETEEKKDPEHTPPAEPTTPQQGTAQPPATTATGDDALPLSTTAVLVPPDETQATTNATRRRRRKRAPRHTYHTPAADAARRSPLLPTPTAGYAPMKAREPYHDRQHTHEAPSSLDRAVRVILEALTTGIAAHLREQGAMPVPHHPLRHRALSHDWRARAGEIPAQKPNTGEVNLPRARPG